MINGKRVMALIPARAGSKGLPGKNTRLLCGKPLIVWTIEKALKSAHLDAVVVSTDSEDIAAIARAAGASVPFLRPAALAQDTSPSIAVVEHALDWFLQEHGVSFDYHVLLEPTSPLREDHDIDTMLARLDAQADHFDAIVSLGETGGHPSVLKRLVGDSIEPFYADLAMTTRRQEGEPAFFPFGVAYITKVATLRQERSFYPTRCTHYRLQRYQHYEIDDHYDFLAVEAVMRSQWGLA